MYDLSNKKAIFYVTQFTNKFGRFKLNYYLYFMQVEIKYRTPNPNWVTIIIGFREYTITLDQYIEIIKPSSIVSGTATEYRAFRNKLLTEYFINGPKEQFSW